MKKAPNGKKILLVQLLVILVLSGFLLSSVTESMDNVYGYNITNREAIMNPMLQDSIASKDSYVKCTLFLSNDTLFKGNLIGNAGGISGSAMEPVGAAFDSLNSYIYVTNHNSENVSVINGATNKIVTSIPIIVSPNGAAFDSSNGYIYVTESSCRVSVINGATNTIVENLPVGECPHGVAFDSSNGYIYVANEFSQNISVINTSTNHEVSSISVSACTDPMGAVFDSSNGYIYVTTQFGNDVYVINGSTNDVIKTIPVGKCPLDDAYDSSNGYIYVTNAGSGNVSVINGSTNNVIKTISVGNSPHGVAFDSSNGYILVTNANSGNVSVINGLTNIVVSTISVGSEPYGTAYDSFNGYMYVENWGSESVSVMDLIKPVTYYTTSFTESNLPSSSTWYVNITETNGTIYDSGPISGSSYSFSLTNSSYTYSIATNNKTYRADGGSFKVNGRTFQENVSFLTAKYKVTFTESGLPSGLTWFVNGSISSHALSGSRIIFYITNGSYTFTVTNTTSSYATVTQYKITVNGKNISESVTYLSYSYISGKISPNNANVTINGKVIKLTTTGAFNITVTAGSYNLIISDNGYKSYYDNFTIKNGITMTVDQNLTKITTPSSSVELYEILGAVVGIGAVTSVVVIYIRKK